MEKFLCILSVEPEQYEIHRIKSEAENQGFSVDVKKPDEYDSKNSQYTHLLVRAIRSQTTLAQHLAGEAMQKGIKVVDEKLALGKGRNKFENYLLFEKAGLYVPKTELLETLDQDELHHFKSEQLVLKPIRGKRGEDLNLIKKPEFSSAVKKLPAEKKFLVQEYVPIKKEFRVVVVGSKVLGAISKHSYDWIHNIAKGATPKKEELSPALKETALKATRAVETEIAGVDIAETADGKLFVLEVNRSPGFKGFEEATKIDVAKEIVGYLESK